MNTKQFVQGVFRHMMADAQGDIQFIQLPPPGRMPQKSDIELHDWYVGMSDDDKEMVHRLIRKTVEGAIFGFLMILDHKMFVESAGEKGELELYFRDTTGERVRLNPIGGKNGMDLEYYFKGLKDSPDSL